MGVDRGAFDVFPANFSHSHFWRLLDGLFIPYHCKNVLEMAELAQKILGKVSIIFTFCVASTTQTQAKLEKKDIPPQSQSRQESRMFDITTLVKSLKSGSSTNTAPICVKSRRNWSIFASATFLSLRSVLACFPRLSISPSTFSMIPLFHDAGNTFGCELSSSCIIFKSLILKLRL
mmetsp:Transcript_24821/g.68408  ORF Transcript_24821/g.68408 Transcript_24821/m.68408 type:complete len:176 (+) Transcript_24821:2241-2768(+)